MDDIRLKEAAQHVAQLRQGEEGALAVSRVLFVLHPESRTHFSPNTEGETWLLLRTVQYWTGLENYLRGHEKVEDKKRGNVNGKGR